jgi:predicted phosphodiesterase
MDNKKFFMVHASHSDPLFTYLKADTPKEQFIREFGNIDADFIIYGHTHFPLVLRNVVKGIIVNPGSIGQPRDGIWLASCAIIDTATEEVEIKRIPYDINKTENEIKEAGLPEVLIDILKAG